MTFFVRAVVTGFGLSLGAALFKKVQHRVPWLADPDPKKPDEPDPLTQDGGSDPSLPKLPDTKLPDTKLPDTKLPDN